MHQDIHTFAAGANEIMTFFRNCYRVPSRNFCLGGSKLDGPCLTKNLFITWTTTVYPTAAKLINSIPVHPSIPTACIYANSG